MRVSIILKTIKKYGLVFVNSSSIYFELEKYETSYIILIKMLYIRWCSSKNYLDLICFR
jgi:hypothetical protein